LPHRRRQAEPSRSIDAKKPVHDRPAGELLPRLLRHPTVRTMARSPIPPADLHQSLVVSARSMRRRFTILAAAQSAPISFPKFCPTVYYGGPVACSPPP